MAETVLPGETVLRGKSVLPGETVWPGEWVSSRLDVRLQDGERPVGSGLADLVGLAVRRNPRRAHLLVSAVLGKHVPTDPRLVYGSGLLLGELVRLCLNAPHPNAQHLNAPHPNAQRDEGASAASYGPLLAGALSGDPGAAAVLRDRLCEPREPVDAMVLGYAETATALGHSVADALGGALYLHSTRRPVTGFGRYGGFEEEHSHATSHLLLPADPGTLERDVPLVLVDDELSTGRTVINTIRALHAIRPRRHYVVAALVDLRSGADRDAFDAFAAEVDARIDVVALATGQVALPEGILETGQELVAGLSSRAVEQPASGHSASEQPSSEHSASVQPSSVQPSSVQPTFGQPSGEPFGVTRVELGWPEDLPDGGRHGFLPEHRERLGKELPAMAARVATHLDAAHLEGLPRVLVLGFEELMYAPLRLAEALADVLPAEADVRYSTTTRSPVLAVDDPGYAIRTRLAFPSHDDPADGPGERYAYNVAPGADPSRAFDAIVLVVDDAGDTPALADGLLAQLSRLAPVVLATVPSYRKAPPVGSQARPLHGPAFGSYPAEDVTWLLKDLSAVHLEAPTEEREAAIQAGRAHYAESLPVEYQPGPEYQRLFHEALDASAERLAHAVGIITEMIIAERGRDAVLVSLARAGTPVGVLIRRWARFAHGLDLPHYAISIVRGRGIDEAALGHLAARYDPARVMFVDGWTGKGAISRELTAALDAYAAATGHRFPADLAVLADPGRCTPLHGTREDFLIPSACLNSTVSGLVSRTVLNAELIGPGDFHGAKFYAELAGADVSATFLDAVCARFGDVAGRVAEDLPGLLAADRTPDWSGWEAVRRVGRAYGVDDLNLIKPGVGETTRVLLRRVPWKILARAGAGAELAHIRLLAAERGVPVEEVDEEISLEDFPYACVGLIHPRFGQGTVQ
ncbi:phosphoribosyltransferase [Actinomadura sp. 9N407]|uniref:phosphoribosyltransferase n=1 Tax=Actinomadura sp. 9N407 TaxID=3375154 RepID=UPI0037B2D26E